jgi:hypothetical protein
MFSKTIILRFCILVAFITGLSLSGFAVDRNHISIPFEVINGLTIIQAEVDGVSGSFLLDTGSNGVFLDGSAEDAEESIVTLGGTSKISIQLLKELKIGSFHQENLEAQIISLEPIEDHLGIELNGIIGGHLFLPKVLTIDFENALITLSDKLAREERKQYENQVSISIVHDVPVAEIEIENNTYQFAMDSGSSIHFIDTKVLQNLNDVKSIDSTSTLKCLANTDAKIKKVNIDQFAINEATFLNHLYLPKDFGDVNRIMGTQLDGILSLSQLSKDVIIIDYDRQKMYF